MSYSIAAVMSLLPRNVFALPNGQNTQEVDTWFDALDYVTIEGPAPYPKSLALQTRRDRGNSLLKIYPQGNMQTPWFR